LLRVVLWTHAALRSESHRVRSACRVGRDQSQRWNEAPGVGAYPGVSEKAFAVEENGAFAFHRTQWLGGEFTWFAAWDVAAGGPMDTRRAP